VNSYSKHPSLSTFLDTSVVLPLLCLRRQLYVPHMDDLRETLLHENHDSPLSLAGHLGRVRTLKALQGLIMVQYMQVVDCYIAYMCLFGGFSGRI
jgi:hypothetical protein